MWRTSVSIFRRATLQTRKSDTTYDVDLIDRDSRKVGIFPESVRDISVSGLISVFRDTDRASNRNKVISRSFFRITDAPRVRIYFYAERKREEGKGEGERISLFLLLLFPFRSRSTRYATLLRKFQTNHVARHTRVDTNPSFANFIAVALRPGEIYSTSGKIILPRQRN